MYQVTPQRCPLNLYLCHIPCPITPPPPQKNQQLSLTLLYAQYEKNIVSQNATKNVNFCLWYRVKSVS